MGRIKISRRLSGWLDLVGWDSKRLAKELNYDPSFVGAMLDGTKSPTLPLMKKMMDMTKMGFELFEYDHTAKDED